MTEQTTIQPTELTEEQRKLSLQILDAKLPQDVAETQLPVI